MADGKFEEIMPIRDDRDFSEFLRLYQVEKSEIKREWGWLSALLDRLANPAAAIGRPFFRKGALFYFSLIAELERIFPDEMRKRLEGIPRGAKCAWL